MKNAFNVLMEKKLIINNNINTIINFGKYKGESFEYVYNKDIKYCHWILQQNTNNENTKKFQFFLKDKLNTNISNEQISCSDLSYYYLYNQDLLNLLNDLIIQKKNTGIFFKSNTKIPVDIYGIYIDYFIRYKLSLFTNTSFTDERAKINLIGNHQIEYVELYNKLKMKYNEQISEKLKTNTHNNPNHLIKETISECLTEIFQLSYIKMNKGIANENDIFNTSLSHSLVFGNLDAYEYVDYIKDNNVDDNSTNLDIYIQEKIKNKSIILCNPTLANKELKIAADADIIIDNELIDIKSSNYEVGNNIKDFIQLFIYIILYYKNTKNKINKISILNPLLGYEKCIDLTDWNKYDELLRILEKRVNL